MTVSAFTLKCLINSDKLCGYGDYEVKAKI